VVTDPRGAHRRAARPETDPAAADTTSVPPGQRFAIEGELGEAPRAERERAHLQGERVVVIAVLRLQMLRREEDALGPEHGGELAHGA
jgi:hypothetical protein